MDREFTFNICYNLDSDSITNILLFSVFYGLFLWSGLLVNKAILRLLIWVFSNVVYRLFIALLSNFFFLAFFILPLFFDRFHFNFLLFFNHFYYNSFLFFSYFYCNFFLFFDHFYYNPCSLFSRFYYNPFFFLWLLLFLFLL